MKLHQRYSNTFLYAALISLMAGSLLTACSDKSSLSKAPQVTEAAATAIPLASVTVRNALDYAHSDATFSVELAELGLSSEADSDAYVFQNGEDVVAHQFIDSDGDGLRDRALFVVDLAAAQEITLSMQAKDVSIAGATNKRTHAEIGIKEGGSWNEQVYEGGEFRDVETVTLPPQYTDHSKYIRYEGPGIESETVGYRVYLDWRNGFDIFAKKEYGLHLANVGLDGYQSYHEPSAWGMDVLKVGKAVGAGGFGIWKEGAIERLSDVQGWTASVIEDGNLYSSFAIDYKGWNTGSKIVDLRAQLSMTAGSSTATVDIKTDRAVDELAVGIVKHDGTQLLQGDFDVTGAAWSYIATLGPQALDGQQLLMYVLFQRGSLNEQVEDEFNHAVLLKVKGGELNYKFGAYWAGEPGSDLSLESVKAMLENEVQQLTFPPRLRIRNAMSDQLKRDVGGIEKALNWSKMAAESAIKRTGNELNYGEFDTSRERDANWEYTTGMMAQSVYQVGKVTGDKAMMGWGKSVIDSYLTDDGSIKTYDVSHYNIDSINSGKMLLALFKDTGEKKYFLAARLLRDQLRTHPRLELGAFWHKQRYPYQLWLDGVYMGMPFLAEYTMQFEEGAALDEVIEEFRVTREYLRNAETGLYFHALDEKKLQSWADPETGLSLFYWARGMGWLAMAIVDTLDFIPQSHLTERQELVAMAKDLIDSLLKYQDAHGVWHQIVDKAGEPGNYPEASSSAMYTYLLVKGVAKGVLPESYRAPAAKAYKALIQEFVLVDVEGNVELTQNCHVGGLGFGRDGSYEYYMSEPIVDNDPKGLAPFLMLGPIANKAFSK